MAGMERFTQRARRVLSLAHQEAERARNNSIEPEHLLLGLMDEEGGVASRVLRELGLKSEQVREAVDRASTSSQSFESNRVELADDTQRVLEHSVEEARRLGHHYIGTEHILLGLVYVESAAIEVLRKLGVTTDQIRRQTRRVLNETASTSQNVSSDNVPGALSARRNHPVLILHGQEDQRKTIAAFIQVLMLNPVLIDSHHEIELGLDLLDGAVKDADLAILLWTNDSRLEEPELKTLGYLENIAYELGYFRGKLGRKHVCVLYQDSFQGEIKSLSTFTGIVFIPFDTAGAWMTLLAKTIQDTGLTSSL